MLLLCLNVRAAIICKMVQIIFYYMSKYYCMNIKVTIKKLQKALLTKGIIYKINTYQFYSKEQQRLITGYRITEKREYKKKNGKTAMKDMELLNTCSQVEVLKWFAEKWRKVNV